MYFLLNTGFVWGQLVCCTVGVLSNIDEEGLGRLNLTCPINQGPENWGGECLTACTWWSAVLH